MARGGSEQVLHTITAHLAQNPGDVLVSLDTNNMFNSVSRGAMLKALLAAPASNQALFPMMAQLYLQDGQLCVYGEDGSVAEMLLSKSGMRQGGPLLFAVAIHPALLRV
jgi:hypothetical protein